jgi:phosphatidylglycerophosphate synthase
METGHSLKRKPFFLPDLFGTGRPFNFAHVLTSIRLILTPFLLCAIDIGWRHPSLLNAALVTGLFLMVCASDYYDGPVARALGLSSDRGKVFDNLADITFLLVTLSYLVYLGTVPWWIPTAVALAFGQYTLDSWLLSGRDTSVVLVSNPIGHWAGILNFIFTGVLGLHTAVQQQLLPVLVEQSVLGFWLGYLLLAMSLRLRFFLQARRTAPRRAVN